MQKILKLMDMTWQELLYSVTLVIIGSALYAFGMNTFVLPNNITTGGVAGVSVLIYYVSHIPVAITNPIINGFLILIGLRYLKKNTIVLTVLCIGLISIFLDNIVPPKFITDNLLIAALAGGVTLGTGMGIVLRGHGSTAGTDIIAMMLEQHLGINFSVAAFICNALVLVGAIFVTNVERTIVSIFMIFVSTRMISLVTEGLDRRKQISIVSNQKEAIADAIITEIGRGVTVIRGYGYFSKQESDMLYIIVNQHQVLPLQRVINRVDPRALVVITDVQNVTGQGFSFFNETNRNNKFYLK